MLIEFRCSNILEFDASTGRYVLCNQKLVAPGDQVGQLVRCDKCRQMIEVPLQSGWGAETPDENRRVPGPTGAPRSEAKAQSSVGKSRPRAESGSDRELRIAEPIERPRSDIMQLVFRDENVQSNLSVSSPESDNLKCPECGSRLNEIGHCIACRYVRPRFETLNLPLNEIKVHLAGFQLWFCKTLCEGVSVRLLGYAFTGLFGLLFVVLFLLALNTGRTTGFVFAAILVAAAGCYIYLFIKAQRLAKDPRARLGWLLGICWKTVLLLSRQMHWQNYDANLKGRKIIDLRGQTMTDENLAMVGGLNNCQVLDLTGTRISDRGLESLYGMTNLKCLVLNKTLVTNDGVFRLQQSNPRLWIWH
jgi:predicted RNA-binding Zn-ribbon protein involved in translation (DUF1610 family)